jgi:hypothetical protein
MTWDIEQPNHDDYGAGTLHRHYEILAVGQDGAVAEIIAKGYADLVFVQNSASNWVIVRWDDRSDPDVDPLLTQKTWGLRRLESR